MSRASPANWGDLDIIDAVGIRHVLMPGMVTRH